MNGMKNPTKLIELVKKYQYLYDYEHADYRNRAKKIEAWTQIAKEMGDPHWQLSGSIWNVKWNTLRNNYNKYKKGNASNFDVHYKKFKTWPWAELMKFLEDNSFFEIKKGTQILNNQDPIPASSGDSDENNKRKTAESAEPEESDNNLEIEERSKRLKLDDVDHFFLSYAQTFKKLPRKSQIILKLEIATLFSQYELQAEEGPDDNSLSSIPRFVPPPAKIESEYNDIDIVKIESQYTDIQKP